MLRRILVMPKKTPSTVRHAGVFDVERNGFSYRHNFIGQHNRAVKTLPGDSLCVDVKDLLTTLSSVPWRTVTYRKFGKEKKTPRQTYCYGCPSDKGDLEVSWKGIRHKTQVIPDWALPLQSAIEKHTNRRYNVMLLNRYESGQDSIGWHTDDEQFLQHTTVASVSLGAVRDFSVEDLDGKRHSLPLASGSLAVLSGVKHALPKRKAQKGVRYNITFRCVATSDGQDSRHGFGNYYRYCRGEE